MKKSDMMEDAESRSVLRAFLSEAAREVQPSLVEPPTVLVNMLSGVADFLLVRNEIAETKVAIARARRPGSSTKSHVKRLEAALFEQQARRQQIISREAASEAFLNETKAERERLEVRMAAWKETVALAGRARTVLDVQRLPTIARPAPLTPQSLVDALERHVSATPARGDLLLMGAEPRIAGRDYDPRSAVDRGLDARIFSGSVRLLCAPGTNDGAQAEFNGAILARDALVMMLGPDRRPIDQAAWTGLDPFLPRATRRLALPVIPCCSPHSSPYGTLSRLLSVDSWRSIREWAKAKTNTTCVMCGHTASGVVKCEWTFLEPVIGGPSYGVQRLDDVNSYCSQCGGVVFPEPKDMVALKARLEPYAKGEEVYVVDQRMDRLSRLNRWDLDAVPNPLPEAVASAQRAHQRRSQVRWALDLSILADRNLVLHPDMAMHPKGWIMRRDDLRIFDDRGSVHLTRVFNAPFATEAGDVHFFELPSIHEFPWATNYKEVVQSDALRRVEEPTVLQEEIYEEPAGPENPDEEDVETVEGEPFAIGMG